MENNFLIDSYDFPNVTDQPPLMNINKYLGFSQLEYIEEKGVPCIIPTEIIDFENNMLTNLKPDQRDKLFSIRVAKMTGRDYDLPSIIGVDRLTAIEWMETQYKIDHTFRFFCSEYFETKISGRMHIELFNTTIEMSLGGFNDFKHGIPDVSISSSFNQKFIEKKNTKKIGNDFINCSIEMSKKLRNLYKDQLDVNSLYEFDFSFLDNKYLDFKVIGMRGYSDSKDLVINPSIAALKLLIDSYKNRFLK